MAAFLFHAADGALGRVRMLSRMRLCGLSSHMHRAAELCGGALNPDVVLSRDQLLNAVWGYSYAGDSNVVDVYVRYVRNRLGEPADGKLIESVRGVGYVMRTQAAEAAQ